MSEPIRMSRRAWVAAWAVLCVAGLAVIVKLSASSAPDPQPTPSRVYSSCLAADTKPVSADDGPCDGR
ncbi:hypothetical protein ACIRFH_10025 [Streptomyces sp. NPDC093586]|uniref:hypothetical protein n=1 Tax=Streptomyces sp. NPDC093586 TaxID=3366042 RepID=UPI003822FBC5